MTTTTTAGQFLPPVAATLVVVDGDGDETPLMFIFCCVILGCECLLKSRTSNDNYKLELVFRYLDLEPIYFDYKLKRYNMLKGCLEHVTMPLRPSLYVLNGLSR